MTAGTPTYVTAPQFAFPRSFMQGLYFRHDGAIVSWDLSQLKVIVAGFPDALVIYTFDDRFVPWSSNRWTIDHVLTAATYEYPPNPTQFPLPYYIGWIIPPGESRGHLLLDCIYGADFSTITLPTQPSGYWLPPPY
jgi:hypothetical protein